MFSSVLVLVAVQQGESGESGEPPEKTIQTPPTETTPQPPASPTTAASEPVGLSEEEIAHFVPALTAAAPGTTNTVTLTMPDGRERRYLYSMPAGPDPQEPLPVLLAMGGWTDPPENFLNYAGFNSSAAASQAVVVYPAGVADAWAGAPYAETTEEEDISFLRAVVAQLATAMPVDRERIYAVGMSNGGGMALELACHAPDLVAGVAAVSGAFYEGIYEGCAATPMASQIIHGTEDELLNYGGGILHDTRYLGVEEVMRQQAVRNGCAAQPADSTPLGDNADQLKSPDCEAPTEHIRVNGGFHDWYIDPATADETWAFLSAQRAVGE
ncbi:alpha/beta hydrolase family esterase [Corynebacterium sp. A21]|uniref:alpha/beta hydrolase family esterase n=1 Tax=Corynebacterium sp. A21 TaxID=3457318 RepID=UPI003FD68D41